MGEEKKKVDGDKEAGLSQEGIDNIATNCFAEARDAISFVHGPKRLRLVVIVCDPANGKTALAFTGDPKGDWEAIVMSIDALRAAIEWPRPIQQQRAAADICAEVSEAAPYIEEREETAALRPATDNAVKRACNRAVDRLLVDLPSGYSFALTIADGPQVWWETNLSRESASALFRWAAERAANGSESAAERVRAWMKDVELPDAIAAALTRLLVEAERAR